MDRITAEQFTYSASVSIAELTKALALAKKSVAPEEYDKYMKVIANISADIIINLINPVFDKYPDLEGVIDKRIVDYR